MAWYKNIKSDKYWKTKAKIKNIMGFLIAPPNFSLERENANKTNKMGIAPMNGITKSKNIFMGLSQSNE